MAGYYTYIVAGLDTSSAAPVRWSHTDDVLTSQPLMAACLPALDRTKGRWRIEEEEGYTSAATDSCLCVCLVTQIPFNSLASCASMSTRTGCWLPMAV